MARVVSLILGVLLIKRFEFILSSNNFSELIKEQLEDLLHGLEISTTDKEDQNLDIIPPKYMIELYQQYSKDLPSDKEVQVIRCILGKVKKQSILFNLSSVTSTSDRIKHAEVHVFSRKSRHGKVARAKFKLRISSSKRKHFSRTVVPLVPTKGWQILDITKTAEIFKEKVKYLKMSIEVPIPAFGVGRERYYPVAVEEVLYTSYRPFLLIYFDDLRKKSLFKSQIRIKSESGFHSKEDAMCMDKIEATSINDVSENGTYHIDNTLMNILQLNVDNYFRNNTREKAENMEDDFVRLDELNNGDLHFINKRSVQDNQLTPDYFEESYHSPASFPSPVQYHISPQYSESEISYDDDEQRLKTDEDDDFNSVLLPHFGQRKHFMNSYSRRRFTKPYDKIQNNLEVIVNQNVEKHPNGISHFKRIHPSQHQQDSSVSTTSSCQLKTQTFNFGNAFTKKIVAPPAFTFNFCDGACTQMEDITGNKITEMEINDEMPSLLCCSPSEWKHFSLLYIDIFQNIVLRSYPNTTISTCKCR